MDKLRTGIKNLDHILDGGIPVYSLNVVSGSPGSGKTIFVQNIIFNTARNGLKSLYLTTISESQFKMVRHLQEFEFFSDDFLGDKVVYEDLGAVLRKQGADKGLEYLTQMIKKHLPDIVVIDSFKAIRDFFPDEKAFKAFVFDLAAALSIWEVTVFLVGEYKEQELTLLGEFAVADGIFHLYGQEEKRFQKRYLRILKMRGANFEQGEHLFQISHAGIEVYPRMRPEGKELQYEARPGRKGFGITGLDEMLCGGLTEGTITLISGGTGTGKTALALKFLLDGAEKGEKGLFLSFEQPVNQLQDTARRLGWEIDRYLAEGRLDIKFISPIELDVDKHAFEILDMVREKKVDRFVIDSISSFESSVSDIQKYKDYLWAIGQQLKRRHITTIFTVLNEDLFSPMVVTKAQISLMADNIIILRYVEDYSSIKKVLGILKARGSDHNKALREYEITPNGINILGKLNRADMLR
ncbi:ATPase domain-containing protein [Candidatus Desulforudis audaxviator]|uniref:non-specific serine/threonine protein kinase n=1 Tax=Desulforudis audaxviator (strain MP104C) TaxID=477974 RepID=B1I2H8_DESAP|nr:ATPase domain-containing protein [Candidatus Desulforudis audaxviator]ACA59221.1 putative circadian clock protein, KaiC [Candidatus Desulforudis audaxviator MP104C]AZK59297.1 Circadian clock protein KaiC [Candidatus Desulforudis audaxviator]